MSARLRLLAPLLALALALAQISPLPGQVPAWPASYAMNASSFVMLCASDGLMPANRTGGWAIVDVDWSNAKRVWAAAKPMDAEELLLQQAELIKSASPSTRVFVYRNSIKALPWFTTVREKLSDPAYAAWFMPFACNGTGQEESALAGAAAASAAGGEEDGCSFVDNEDYDQGASGPLPTVSAASPAECCAACGNYSGCWAATFLAGACTYNRTKPVQRPQPPPHSPTLAPNPPNPAQATSRRRRRRSSPSNAAAPGARAAGRPGVFRRRHRHRASAMCQSATRTLSPRYVATCITTRSRRRDRKYGPGSSPGPKRAP